MANFAIKDAMDVKIKVLGESSPKIVIDYLNECSLSKTIFGELSPNTFIFTSIASFIAKFAIS